MVAAMAELTRQNQDLRMEINLRRQTREEREGGGQTQSHDDRENIEIGSQLRGTTSRTVPHLKEEMDQIFYRIRPSHIFFHFFHDFLHLIHFFFQVWYCS